MWNKDNNPNILIIGSSYAKEFEIIDMRQNKWQNYYINDVLLFDDLFGVKERKTYSRSRLLY